MNKNKQYTELERKISLDSNCRYQDLVTISVHNNIQKEHSYYANNQKMNMNTFDCSDLKEDVEVDVLDCSSLKKNVNTFSCNELKRAISFLQEIDRIELEEKADKDILIRLLLSGEYTLQEIKELYSEEELDLGLGMSSIDVNNDGDSKLINIIGMGPAFLEVDAEVG